jgi:hypothetical protein
MIASEIGSRIGLKLVEGKAAEEMLAAVVSRAVLMVTAALLCTSLALGLQREIWLRGAIFGDRLPPPVHSDSVVSSG